MICSAIFTEGQKLSTSINRRCRIVAALEAHVLAKHASASSKSPPPLAEVVTKGVAAMKSVILASHIMKAIHTRLHVKDASNLAVDFDALPASDAVGSHVLAGRTGLLDTTGSGSHNGAAHALYALLETQFEGQKIIDLLRDGDQDAVSIFDSFGPDSSLTDEYLERLANDCPPATHSLGKSVYWLRTGGCAVDDGSYELLVPLFPSSLVAEVQKHLDEARYGQKEVRAARAAGLAHDGVLRFFPDLALLRMGGSKPQNVSHFVSERGGKTFLLSSLPPHWGQAMPKTPDHAESVFSSIYGSRPHVVHTVEQLRKFLESDPPPNLATRCKRDAFTQALIDELFDMVALLREHMQPGWTLYDERFHMLDRSEQLWLDPMRALLPGQESFAQEWQWMDWPKAIATHFGNWLKLQMGPDLKLGAVEEREWVKALLADQDGFRAQLREMRNALGATHDIPVTQTHADLSHGVTA